MKRVIWMLATTLVLGTGVVRGQQADAKGESREKIAEAKRAYLVKELNLTSEEVSKVMEVIAELDEQRFRLWQESKETRERIRKKDMTLTDEELKLYLERKLDNKVREAELERIYYKKLSTIIPVRKLVLLDHLEKRFARNYMFDRLKVDGAKLKNQLKSGKGLDIPHQHEH